MGDAGSLFLGFVLVWFLVALSQGEERRLAPVTALWLCALPLIDTISMMVRRMLLRRSPFLVDQEHFHHILLAAGFSPKQTLVMMLSVALDAACTGLAGHFLGVPEHWMFFGFLGLLALHFRTIMWTWYRRRFWGRPLLPRDDAAA